MKQAVRVVTISFVYKALMDSITERKGSYIIKKFEPSWQNTCIFSHSEGYQTLLSALNVVVLGHVWLAEKIVYGNSPRLVIFTGHVFEFNGARCRSDFDFPYYRRYMPPIRISISLL